MDQKFEVIDNFLDEDSFLELKQFITTPRCDWRFISAVTFKGDRGKAKDGYFIHSFKDCNPTTLEDRFPVSPHYQKLDKLMNKITQKVDYKNILRVRSSLYPRRDTQRPNPPHVDYEFPHKVCLFYVNTNNGHTLFEEDEKKIPSVENRLLIFDGLQRHSSVVQTDTPARFIININVV